MVAYIPTKSFSACRTLFLSSLCADLQKLVNYQRRVTELYQWCKFFFLHQIIQSRHDTKLNKEISGRGATPTVVVISVAFFYKCYQSVLGFLRYILLNLSLSSHHIAHQDCALKVETL